MKDVFSRMMLLSFLTKLGLRWEEYPGHQGMVYVRNEVGIWLVSAVNGVVTQVRLA